MYLLRRNEDTIGKPQVYQARNMSIGGASALLRNIQNKRICMGKKPIVSVTHENERISIKKQLTLHKMCVTSLLCGPRADLWPFHGFLCKRFSLYINLYIERQILILWILRNNADAHISRLGYLWANKPFIPCFTIMVKIAFTIILSKNLNIMTCLISS